MLSFTDLEGYFWGSKNTVLTLFRKAEFCVKKRNQVVFRKEKACFEDEKLLFGKFSLCWQVVHKLHRYPSRGFFGRSP